MSLSRSQDIYTVVCFEDNYLAEGLLFLNVSRHYNICQFYGLYRTADKNCYLVMERYTDSLQDLIKKMKITHSRKMDFCKQIAQGTLIL